AAPLNASAMPVLPDVESMIVLPGRSLPLRSPSRTIHTAGRSFTEPPGLKPSSLATMRTRGDTPVCSRRISTSGVLPTRSGMAGARPQRAASTAGMRWSGSVAMLRSPPRDGRDDGDLVAVLYGCIETAEKTNVVAIDVDVDEPADAALFIAQPLL